MGREQFGEHSRKGSEALVLGDHREKEEEPREREGARRMFSEPGAPGTL